MAYDPTNPEGRHGPAIRLTCHKPHAPDGGPLSWDYRGGGGTLGFTTCRAGHSIKVASGIGAESPDRKMKREAVEQAFGFGVGKEEI